MATQSFPLLTMEAANIFCGVEEPSDPTQSNHLRLTDIKLPGMDEQYVDHRAAGAPIAIEIDTVFARLECTFTLAGWSTDVAALIAQWGSNVNQFWIFGALRDRVTGNVLQGKASIFGRLGRADPQMWRRGDVSHWAYALKGIVRYKLDVGQDSPVYEFDYFNNIFNVAGTPVTQAVNAALNIT
jgi:P2 family phage contractile tail tube protein